MVFHAALASGGVKSVERALLEVKTVLSQDVAGPSCNIHGPNVFKVGPVEVRRVYISSGYVGYPVPVSSDLPHGGAVVAVFVNGRVVAEVDLWITHHCLRREVRRAIRQYYLAVAQ